MRKLDNILAACHPKFISLQDQLWAIPGIRDSHIHRGRKTTHLDFAVVYNDSSYLDFSAYLIRNRGIECYLIIADLVEIRFLVECGNSHAMQIFIDIQAELKDYLNNNPQSQTDLKNYLNNIEIFFAKNLAKFRTGKIQTEYELV